VKNRKTLFVLLFVSLILCLTLVAAFPTYPKNVRVAEPNDQEVGTHHAQAQDLVSESDEKILEVTEALYRTTEIGLDSSSVQVKNLSGKNITAIGIVWTITFTDGRSDEIEQLVDYRLHPDIVKAKGVRPFAPFEEKFIPRLTKESFEEGQAIKSIKVGFSFAEFEDAGGVGIEKSDMYKQLLSQRQGAEIYKHWIENGYEDTPQGISRLTEKLSGAELPGNPELKDDQVQRGVLIYRQWVRDILKDGGENALREHMRRQLLRRGKV
jgi:hypothetical protein